MPLKPSKQFIFVSLKRLMNSEQDISQTLAELFREAARFTVSDPLVSLRPKKQIALPERPSAGFTLANDGLLRKLIAEDESFAREKGSETLCLAYGCIHLEHGKKGISSPLYLYPLSHTFSKIHDTRTFEFSEENYFFNPFLEKEYPELIPPENTLPETHLAYLKTQNYSIDEDWRIDNFHYHRRSVIHDLSKLVKLPLNGALSLLLEGSEVNPDKAVLPFRSAHFFDISPEQRAVLDLLRNDHVVLQGPPGTGKSQVIAECAAQAVRNGTQTLIVSEKKVALDVIAGKLQSAGLAPFSYCFSATHNARSFIRHLRDTWNLVESYESEPNFTTSRSEDLLRQLDFQLELFRREDLIGGMSFSDFFKLFPNIREVDLPYIADLSETTQVLKYREELEFILQSGLQDLLAFVRDERSFTEQLPELFEMAEEVSKNLPVIEIMCRETGICETNKKLTLFDVDRLRKLAVEAQVLETVSGKKYRRFASKKGAVTIQKLQARALKAERDQEQVRELNKKWKIRPSEADICRFQGYSAQTRGEKRRTKRLFRKMAFDRSWKLEDALQDLEKTEAYRLETDKLFAELTNLGITDPAELREIHAFTTSWRPLHETRLAERLIPELAELNPLLNRFIRRLERFFILPPETPLTELLASCQEKETLLRLHAQRWSHVPKKLIKELSLFGDFDKFLIHAAKHDYLHFEQRFPDFSTLTEMDLLSKTAAIVREERMERKQLLTETNTRIATKFAKFNELLRTSSRKLSDKDKQLKRELRQGKLILVKAFSRRKKFPAVHELFHSEARHWIDLLIPVILCNPEQAASAFPLIPDHKDLLIFDEATQIPFYNAVPIVFRAKCVLVAGDEHQMGPSAWFEGGGKDIPDLLHEAQFYFRTRALREHLRSEHPDLIAFSNRYFYGNALKPYPAALAVSEPLIFEYVPQAVYDSGTNAVEAKSVAHRLTELIRSDKHIGLVAFSEKQLERILSELEPAERLLLDERIDAGTAFAKPLEKVQGDECDILLISLGYGKDKNDRFALRFGPLNEANGARRLNVLMTRARQQIVFCSSVRANDFPLSANESVNLLKNLLSMLEDTANTYRTVHFPLPEKTAVSENDTLYLQELAKHFSDAASLVSFYKIAVKKGWKIAIRQMQSA